MNHEFPINQAAVIARFRIANANILHFRIANAEERVMRCVVDVVCLSAAKISKMFNMQNTK